MGCGGYMLYGSRFLRISCFPSQSIIKQISNKYQANIKQIQNKAMHERRAPQLTWYIQAAFFCFPFPYPPNLIPKLNLSISISLTSTSPKKSLRKVPFFRHKSQIPPDFVAAGKSRQNTTNVGVRMCLLCFLCS